MLGRGVLIEGDEQSLLNILLLEDFFGNEKLKLLRGAERDQVAVRVAVLDRHAWERGVVGTRLEERPNVGLEGGEIGIAF
jgi:hypothetical protein